MKHKLESRLPGYISITSDMQMIPPYGRKRRGTKEPLDESERESIWNLERWYARQQKRHRCIEQSFGLCGRKRGWDDLRE